MSIDCTHIVYDDVRGEYICIDTGEVLADHIIDERYPYRTYSGEEWLQRAHHGALTNRVHHLGLYTDIDISKSFRSYREHRKALKLKRMQKSMKMNRKDEKLVDALILMNRIAAQLELPEEVKETAGKILHKVIKGSTIRQRMILAYVIAAILTAAKMHGIPRRAKEILPMFGVPEEDYWKALAKIQFTLGSVQPLDPRAFLQRIITNLGLSQKVYTLASRIIDVMKRRGYTEGKDPAGIAAAAVYVASIIVNEKKTQKDIAKAARVTEVTIRNRYRDIVDKLYIEVEV